mgnify:CR=1 FL=1
MARIVLCIVALTLLTACMTQEPTWYEDRCLRLGFKAGSAKFNDCIARDRRWIEDNEPRASGTVGP